MAVPQQQQVTAKSVENALKSVLSFFGTWARLFAAIGLVILILLKIASAFPQIPGLIPIASIDWQQFGIFVAGAAFALGTRP
jgi:hypothetical protein